jgi:branched-chain amino acid transport system substrate-binding protein
VDITPKHGTIVRAVVLCEGKYPGLGNQVMGIVNKYMACGCMALVTAVMLSACEDRKPFKIGFVGGLTGRTADLGVAGRNGAMLAVEQRNAEGGIKGRKVELVVRDDGQDPETSRHAVDDLIKQEVAAIIGPMTSSMAIAVVPQINSARVVMISPTVTTNDLTGKDDYFLRVSSPTSENAVMNARYQFTKCGFRKAAAIYDLNNAAYTESWLQDFSADFEKQGGRMVGKHAFRSGSDTVFTGLIGDLLKSRPDVVVIIANAVDAALICQQVRKVDRKVGLDMSEWAATERLLELGGNAVEGAYVDQYFNRDDTSPRYLHFMKSFHDRFGLEPGFAGVAAYDAMNVALDALATGKRGQPLKETLLSSGPFRGIQQPISFDRFGEARRKTYNTTIRNGRFVTVD